MMKSGRNRIIGMILCIAMALGSFPVSLFADDTGSLVVDDGSQSQVVQGDDAGGSESGDGSGLIVGPAPDGSGGASGGLDSGLDGLPQGDPPADPAGDPPSPADELEAAKTSLKFQTAVAPADLLGGESSTLIMYLGRNEYNGPEIQASKIKAVVTVPKGLDVTVQGSEMFTDAKATDPVTGITTVTMSLNALPAVGEGQGREYITFRTQNGVVDHGTAYDIDVRWMYGDDVLFDTLTHPLTVETSKFQWSSLTHNATSANVYSYDNQNIGEYTATTTFYYRINNNFNTDVSGKSFTKSILFEEEFLVSEDVLLTQEMLDENKVTAQGTWTFTPLEYYNGGDPGQQSIKKFRATLTSIENVSLNGSNPADMASVTANTIPLTLKVKINREKVDPASTVGTQRRIDGVIKTSAYTATVKPYALVKTEAGANPHITLDGESNQQQVVNGTGTYSLNVYYTRPATTPGEDANPLESARGNKDVRYRININGVSQSNRNIAYPGDQVIFYLPNFGNYSNVNLDDFKISDTVSQDEMTLIRYSPGRYTGYGTARYYTVRVYVKSGGTEREAIRNNHLFSTNYDNDYWGPGHSAGHYIELLGAKGNIAGSADYGQVINASDISRIEFDYGTYQTPDGGTNVKNSLEPGFRPNNTTWNSPALGMLIKNNGQSNPPVGSGQPQPIISNTANLSYAYTYEDEGGQEVTKTYPQDAELEVDKQKYTWKKELAYYADSQTPAGSEKKGIKLRGENPTGPVENGDLVEYTVTFSHKSVNYPDALYNPFVNDIYEGMVPYVEDPEGLLANYGDAPFMAVLKVTDIKGTDVTAARDLKFQSYHIGQNEPGAGQYDPPITVDNHLRIRFTGKIYYGDTISVTYVMKITDKNNIKNKFEAWAYPPGSGGGPIQIGGGSSSGGGGGIAKQIKPTVTMTQAVTNPNGAANTSANTVDKDGELTVKLVITNTAFEKNAGGVSLYGILSRLNIRSESGATDTFQDALEHLSANASYKYYKYGAATPAEEGEMIRHSTAAGFNVDGVWVDGVGYQLKEGLLSTKSIVLNKGDWIEVEYKVKATDWLQGDKFRAYERIYSYAAFGELTTDYAAPNGTPTDDRTTNYDKNDKTQSFIQAYKDVYFSKEDLFYVGVSRGGSTTPLVFNRYDDHSNMPARASSTYAPTVTVFNYSAAGKTLTFDKIFVRLPKYERFNGMTSTTYKGEALEGLYGPDGDKRQVVIVTRANGQPMSINAGSSLSVYLKTTMTEETLAEALKEAPPQAQTSYYNFNSDFEALIHTPEESIHSTPNNPIVAVTDAELDQWGGDALGIVGGSLVKAKWSGVANTTPNGYNMHYRRYYPAPRLTMNTQKMVDNAWVDVTDGEPFATGARVSWKVNVNYYNSTSYRQMLKNTVVVMKLPTGVEYRGVREGGVTVQELTVDGVNYLIVPLDAINTTAGKTFILEGNTGNSYGGKEVETYLFTNEEFYAASNSTANPNISIPMTKTQTGLPVSQIGAVNDTYDLVVKAQSRINISGMFAFVMNKTVSNGQREITTPTRNNTSIDYTLEFKNNSVLIDYSGVTIIDRLPIDQDNFIVDPITRGSNTAVKLKNAHPTVTLNTGGTNKTLVEGTDYTLEYADIGAKQGFVDKDFQLNEDGKTSEITWTPANNWPDVTTASVFRIMLKNSMAKGATLNVKFTGTALTDTMPNKNALSVNTFAAGFSATLGGATLGIKPESDSVRVKYPDSNPMIIEGLIFEDLDFDAEYSAAQDRAYVEARPQEDQKLRVELYDKKNPGAPKETQIPGNGKYSFEVQEPGTYYVKLVNIPDHLNIHDTIVETPEGNRFFEKTRITDEMTLPEGNAATIKHIRNGALVTETDGQLTIQKKLALSGLSPGSIGGKKQRFVFRIDYQPLDPNAPAQTFYEVLQGDASRVITGLPRGTYTVTELSWATGFEQVGDIEYGSTGQTITYQNQEIEAKCTNKKLGENYLHAIDSVVNKFKPQKRFN